MSDSREYRDAAARSEMALGPMTACARFFEGMNRTSGSVQGEVYHKLVRCLKKCRDEKEPFDIMLAGFAAPHTPETVFHAVKELLSYWVNDTELMDVGYRVLAVDRADGVHDILGAGPLAERIGALRSDGVVDIKPVRDDIADVWMSQVARGAHLTWVDCLLSCADNPEGVVRGIRNSLDEQGIVLLRELLVKRGLKNLWSPPDKTKIEGLPYTFLSQPYFKGLIEDNDLEARQLPLSVPRPAFKNVGLTETAWVLYPRGPRACI